MKTVDLPTLRASNCTAVTLEAALLTDQTMWVVTVRENARAPHRRWYPDEPSALAYAAEAADRHGLLLIDLREPGALQ